MADLKEKANQFLEQLYVKSGETSRIMDAHEVLQDLGMDEQTGISVVEYLAGRNVLKILARSYDSDASVLQAVQLTADGLRYVERLRDAKGGIPLYYTEDLEPKSDRELLDFIQKLEQRLGQIDPGSRIYDLAEKRIAQAKYALEHRGARRDRRRSTWALIIALLAIAVSVALKFLVP